LLEYDASLGDRSQFAGRGEGQWEMAQQMLAELNAIRPDFTVQ
jgi:hypothetical protein